ncbi:hypothetical protein BXY85_0095 [Roseivirga pacifica]|uniref:Uncharacterized protein n=1 Tax=Roseivirga pacifica TaxID=1267423 RepID=A0A1I0R6D7_9BACT|nr:hypothetical protein [Roseivirga pacifica]RKQ49107.1 hypothetical protein BXY85_0095 [Roseivirga pacifica]SEW36151.1 hypothetical protein SAMN05216290_3148 [Roseivirga pacifica]
MNFRASFCDPFNPEIIELGEIEQNKIMESFEKIPWNDFLDKMKTVNNNEIHYSPSLEVENKENKTGLSVSAIDGTEWYIFFKRPKMVKKWFGLVEKMDDNYLTDVTGQSIDDVRNCLNALINNDLDYLEKHIG